MKRLALEVCQKAHSLIRYEKLTRDVMMAVHDMNEHRLFDVCVYRYDEINCNQFTLEKAKYVVK